MSEISKIFVEGVEYDIEDEQARLIIEAQQIKIDELEKSLPTFVLDGTTPSLYLNVISKVIDLLDFNTIPESKLLFNSKIISLLS